MARNEKVASAPDEDKDYQMDFEWNGPASVLRIGRSPPLSTPVLQQGQPDANPSVTDNPPYIGDSSNLPVQRAPVADMGPDPGVDTSASIQTATAMPSLMDLPMEMIDRIANTLPSISELVAFSQTCRVAHVACQRVKVPVVDQTIIPVPAPINPAVIKPHPEMLLTLVASSTIEQPWLPAQGKVRSREAQMLYRVASEGAVAMLHHLGKKTVTCLAEIKALRQKRDNIYKPIARHLLIKRRGTLPEKLTKEEKETSGLSLNDFARAIARYAFCMEMQHQSGELMAPPYSRRLLIDNTFIGVRMSILQHVVLPTDVSPVGRSLAKTALLCVRDQMNDVFRLKEANIKAVLVQKTVNLLRGHPNVELAPVLRNMEQVAIILGIYSGDASLKHQVAGWSTAGLKQDPRVDRLVVRMAHNGAGDRGAFTRRSMSGVFGVTGVHEGYGVPEMLVARPLPRTEVGWAYSAELPVVYQTASQDWIAQRIQTVKEILATAERARLAAERRIRQKDRDAREQKVQTHMNAVEYPGQDEFARLEAKSWVTEEKQEIKKKLAASETLGDRAHWNGEMYRLLDLEFALARTDHY